jgi:peptidoglycan/LPS O-acetylase OafA/YrhL
MLWVIQNPSRFIGRILNSPVIVHIGRISFSLYLWQQIFLTEENKTVTGRFPLNLVLIIAIAECSYWFVEKPFLGWRKRFVADA